MTQSKLPSLRSLTFISTDDGTGPWVKTTEFTQLLKKNHAPTDKDIRPYNILRKCRILTIDCQKYVDLHSILKIAFEYSGEINLCSQICAEIQNCILTTSEATSSIQALYQRVAAWEFRDPSLEKLFTQTSSEIQVSVPWEHNYKNDFTSLKWRRICLFEWHYQKTHANHAELEFSETVNARWAYLFQLQNAVSLAKALHEASQNIILDRTRRKNIANDNNAEVVLYAKHVHCPTVMQLSIESYLETFAEGITTVLCVPCPPNCSTLHGIHVCIEIGHISSETAQNLAKIIQTSLYRNHQEHCHEVLFFNHGAFEIYQDESGVIDTFRLVDDIEDGLLHEEIHQKWINMPEMSEVTSCTAYPQCEVCFPHTHMKPLQRQNFNLFQEYELDVPLIGQITLESFINKASTRKTREIEEFLHSKILRLYANFDVLLHIYNKNYTGVLQDLQSEQLVASYHNVGSVFAVTSLSGCTTSLREAEERLKEKTSSRMCYFNTYVRKFPITYNSIGGEKTSFLSLQDQDCFLVYMVDNLVRLRNRRDPDPGESRTKQLCFLPITVKGMPKDIAEESDWHEHPSCDGSVTCQCKKAKILGREDAQKKILELLPDERKATEKYTHLATWGFLPKWHDIITANTYLSKALQKIIQQEITVSDTRETSSCSTETDVQNYNNSEMPDLDESMRSLKLDDSSLCYEGNYEETEWMPTLEIREDEGQVEDITNVLFSDSDAANLDGKTTVSETLFCDEDICQSSDSDDHIPDHEETNLDVVLEAADLEEDEEDFVEHFKPLYPDSILSEDSENNHLNSSTKSLPAKDHLDISTFGFKIYTPPPMICRHPPPATGRDDDVEKNIELMDKFLKATHHTSQDRIHTGPDHKVANAMIKARKKNPKYQIFLLDFPVLHLRKSRINSVCTSYSKCGLIHLLKYMRDDDVHQEWARLITAEHIETATKHIRRIALAIRLALIVRFMESLPQKEVQELHQVISSHNIIEITSKWHSRFEDFLSHGSSVNATFALHVEMMYHCDEIGAISLAERIGGSEGYHLLLGAVKNALPHAYLNGASSYAAFTTYLLNEHYSSSYYEQRRKECIFSAPHGSSTSNFGLDTQRELDHLTAKKCFRPGASSEAVARRMAAIDLLTEAENYSFLSNKSRDNTHAEEDNTVYWKLSNTDMEHVNRTAGLILRRKALSLEKNDIPCNMYTRQPTVLAEAFLDKYTFRLGKYLIQAYLAKEGLCQMKATDLPNICDIEGPQVLKSRIMKGKSITIKRTTVKTAEQGSHRLQREKKRKQKVKQQYKKLEAISSDMNTCQAIVQPDCSKPKVQKASGIPRALIQLLAKCIAQQSSQDFNRTSECDINELIRNGYYILGASAVPEQIKGSIQVASVEFAGVKFKTKAVTGNEYIENVQNNVILRHLKEFPHCEHLIIVEEKYHFTPDDLKAGTRAQRQQSKNVSIAHLRADQEIISQNKFSKEAVISTTDGKKLISTYLAANIGMMRIHKTITVDIDSELYMEGCSCLSDNCSCDVYAIPVRCTFNNTTGVPLIMKLPHIQQRKGEAEMSQADWLIEAAPTLQEGKGVASLVSSGDIDALTIHLFTVSHRWPRNEEGKFLHPVYVVLEKRKSRDLYNITAITELLESSLKKRYIAMNVSIALCLGGNDFLPRYHGITHAKLLKIITENDWLESLVCMEFDTDGILISAHINDSVFLNVMKHAYCNASILPTLLTFEEVRQVSIQMPVLNTQPSMENSLGFRNPKSWLPPASALMKVMCLANSQIKYLLTCGNAEAKLPDFMASGGLKLLPTGEVEYDLGPESHVDNIEKLLEIPNEVLLRKVKEAKQQQGTNNQQKRGKKRQLPYTPQKGRRGKLPPKTSTPCKDLQSENS